MHGFHVRDAVILFLESFIRKKKNKEQGTKKGIINNQVFLCVKIIYQLIYHLRSFVSIKKQVTMH